MFKTFAKCLPFAALVLAAPVLAQTQADPTASAQTDPAPAATATPVPATPATPDAATAPDAPAASDTQAAPVTPDAAAASAAPSFNWTLAGSDASGAMAYADPGDGTLVAVLRVAQPIALDEVAQYSGFAIMLKPDCTAMTETVVGMTYYTADKTVISSMGGAVQPIRTDQVHGPDSLATAKCQGQPLPQGETFTGTVAAVQDWLDAAVAKNTAPAS